MYYSIIRLYYSTSLHKKNNYSQDKYLFFTLLDNTEMEFVNKYCETDNDLQISNKINVDKHTINNSSCTELFQIIQHFSKINMKEVEPSIKNINETIFEGDLILIVDELVNLIFKEMNEEKDYKIIKKHVYNYINNHETNSQEIHDWLLNNQNGSNNSIYLLGYFNCHGIETNINKQKALISKKRSNYLKKQ